jgi:NAD(P)-dependent dehydrogenase (short-subunit alcohol dehydrogenase family)
MKTAVVTGGNRGIGRAVVKDLAAQGWRVVFVARDEVKGREVEAALSSNKVQFVQGDLSSVRTTKLAAERVLEVAPVIDVLVHNAGVWPSRLELNEDGVEHAFAVNHVAPFVLNRLLEDAIANSEEEHHRRVVVVSAGLYIKGRVDTDVTKKVALGEAFHPLRTYADTKLCNLLLLDRTSKHLANRGITINAVHPGVIRTELGDRGGPLGLLVRAVKLLWKKPEEGAKPVVRLATDPSLKGVTNRYFHLDEEMPLADVAKNEEIATRLWDHAEDLWLRHTNSEHPEHPQRQQQRRQHAPA